MSGDPPAMSDAKAADDEMKFSWVSFVCGVILVWLNLERIVDGRPGWFKWVGFTVGVLLLGGEVFKWRLRQRKEKNRSDEGEPLRSLVFLLQEPRRIDGQEWIAHLSTALGVMLNESGDTSQYFVMPMPHPVIEEGKGNCFMLKIPEGVFWILNVGKPYIDDVEDFAAKIVDGRLRAAFSAHRAWISVDLLHWEGQENRTAIYATIGRILAALAGPDVLAIFSPELQRCNEFTPALVAQLSGGDPLSIFDGSTYAPVVSVDQGDSDMEVAVAEAKRRWQEFAAHFSHRDPTKDQPFIVKAPFGKAGDQEFMWVSVEMLDEDFLRGKLANQPHRIPDMHEGQEVTVPIPTIVDWMCLDEQGKPLGGWTQQLLAKRAGRA